ncbi:HEPN domain-containing protein [Dehalococcoidia bacterium]|nr:HEPN domain-containing protein [Dehalococcoidia bacterium]MCL0065058.1 HEPN domain-containing protein [Dehalococcoidia bacterium]
MKEKTDLVKAWIKKAENDLKTAKDELNTKGPALDTVCFHAQQCAEKYLKAFLVHHEIEFEKIHDLGDLLTLASRIDNSFLTLLELGKKLTPYAVEIRYPLLLEEPTMEEAEEAIEMAIKIKEFVLSRLPVENERSD